MILNIDSIDMRYVCLIAALAAACAPDKSDSDSEGDASTGAATTDAPTTDTPTGDGPLQDMCASQGATSDVTVAWGVPLAPCEAESCSDERDAPCTVAAITSDGPTVLTLDCAHEGLGMTTDVVTIDLQPGGTIDLDVGAAVQLTYRSESIFEFGGSSSLRITDDRGLVLAAGSLGRGGGGPGDTQWALDFLAPLALPLTATIASAGCPEDGTLSAVTVAADNSEVTVAQGNSASLGDGDTWLVIVEEAAINYAGLVDGRLDLAILRVEE